MSDKLIFAASTVKSDVRMTAYVKNDRLTEVHFSDEEQEARCGHIYIGKVVSMSKNLQAVFVDIGAGQNCYCEVSEFANAIFTKKTGSKPVCIGDELIVQVAKEAVKSKGPLVTTRLTLNGTYVVLTTEGYGLKCSAKFTPEIKQELTAWFTGWLRHKDEGAMPYGVLLRTSCMDAPHEKVAQEYELLCEKLTTLIEKARFRKCKSELYAPESGVERALTRLSKGAYSEIVTDDAAEYETLKAQTDVPVRLYHDNMLPLAKLYNLELQTEKALRKEVWLKSGAYLVIEPTEALVSIDINTGKCERGRSREETFYKINREAAWEIARQLRLRRLSGIIIIDFINMEEPEHKRELLKVLKDAFADDPLHPDVVGMTRLGLVEVTRRKSERPLAGYFRC